MDIVKQKKKRLVSSKIPPEIRTRENFWSKVDKSGDCWEWLASKTMHGYGRFAINRKPVSAHRVVWLLTYGEIPEGLSVCHRCDNPACVRPEHLFLGTHLDNMTDMYTKKRRPPNLGTKNGRSKLSEKQVEQIRAMYVPRKMSYPKIAKLFGISRWQVSKIILRKDWTHV